VRAAAWLVVIAVGCAGHRTMHRAELVMGGALAGVLATSIVLAIQPDAKPVALPLIAGFGAIAVGGLVVYMYADATAKDPPPAIELHRADERAWQLTRKAAAAARAGDCTTARAIASDVRALDEDFYTTVFARDAAISRCVQRAR
jgi:hypothetical protein